MRVLVTGGAGYIGTHVIYELLSQNHEVVSVDHDEKPNFYQILMQHFKKEISYYIMDYADPQVESILQKHQIEAIIHIAAKKSVPESTQRVIHYFDNNVKRTISLLEMCERAGVKSILFSSSAAVYGNQDLCTESSPFMPDAPYGRTKAMVDQIFEDLGRYDKTWSLVSLRYFNVVGAHPSGIIGEKNDEVTNLFPVIGKVIRKKQQYLQIFGTDWDTPDGSCVRDYIHVVDLAKAHIMALDHLNPGYEAFCLGTGRGYSVKEVVATFQEVLGVELPKKEVDRRPGDVRQVCAVPDKANQKIGWRAQYTLKDMVTHTVAWEQKMLQKPKL